MMNLPFGSHNNILLLDPILQVAVLNVDAFLFFFCILHFADFLRANHMWHIVYASTRGVQLVHTLRIVVSLFLFIYNLCI